MKKLFITAIMMVAFTSVSMASTIVVKSTKNQTNVGSSTITGTVSCRRTVSTPCSNGDVSVGTYTATVPSTGDLPIDMGNACTKALAKAKSMSISACQI